MWLDWRNIVWEQFVPCKAVGSYGVVFLPKWEGVVDVVSRNEEHLGLDHGTLIFGILGVGLEIIGTILIVIVEHLEFLRLQEYVIIWVYLSVRSGRVTRVVGVHGQFDEYGVKSACDVGQCDVCGVL